MSEPSPINDVDIRGYIVLGSKVLNIRITLEDSVPSDDDPADEVEPDSRRSRGRARRRRGRRRGDEAEDEDDGDEDEGDEETRTRATRTSAGDETDEDEDEDEDEDGTKTRTTRARTTRASPRRPASVTCCGLGGAVGTRANRSLPRTENPTGARPRPRSGDQGDPACGAVAPPTARTGARATHLTCPTAISRPARIGLARPAPRRVVNGPVPTERHGEAAAINLPDRTTGTGPHDGAAVNGLQSGGRGDYRLDGAHGPARARGREGTACRGLRSSTCVRTVIPRLVWPLMHSIDPPFGRWLVPPWPDRRGGPCPRVPLAAPCAQGRGGGGGVRSPKNCGGARG